MADNRFMELFPGLLFVGYLVMSLYMLHIGYAPSVLRMWFVRFCLKLKCIITNIFLYFSNYHIFLLEFGISCIYDYLLRNETIETEKIVFLQVYY